MKEGRKEGRKEGKGRKERRREGRKERRKRRRKNKRGFFRFVVVGLAFLIRLDSKFCSIVCLI